MNSYKKLKKTVMGVRATEEFSFSTRLLFDKAKEQGFTLQPIPDSDLMEISRDGKVKYFAWQTPLERNSLLSHYATINKQVTKFFLNKAGIRTMDYYLVDKNTPPAQLLEIFNKFKKRVVIKPTNGTHGNDVLIDIVQFLDFESKIALLLQKYEQVLVEEMFLGKNEYRLTATADKFLAITKRLPARVCGDGKRTVQELMTEKNVGRASSMKEGSLVTIKIDDETKELLQEQAVNLNSVLAVGQTIKLKRVSNISAGGDSVNCQDKVHTSIKDLAVRCVQAMPKLYFAGIDLMCDDITKDLKEQNYTIIEINDSPGFSLSQLPYQGEKVDIAASLLELIWQD